MKVAWHYLFFPYASQDDAECVQGLRSCIFDNFSRQTVNSRYFADTSLLNCFLDLVQCGRKIKVIYNYLLRNYVQSCGVNSRGFAK